MLRTIRLTTAIVCFTLITLLFLDFTGTLHTWFGWLAKIQFLPALLALNIGVVLFLIILTILFGRIYCSVICPMGIFQDVVAWIAKRINRKKHYRYTREKRVLRYGVLGIVVLAFLLGATVLLSLLDPYSAFGRMGVNVFRPVYLAVNNLLAWVFNSFGNYTFYHTDIYVLEKNDPAYVMQIPKSVLEYDEEQMPENPRNKRSPLGDDE